VKDSTTNDRRAEADRLRYHNPDGIYRSTIGIADPEGNLHCVGCWWCEGPGTTLKEDE
jgi:hypothetical protein